MKRTSKVVIGVVAAASIVAVGTSSGAVAAAKRFTNDQLGSGAVDARVLASNSVGLSELSPAAEEALSGRTGATGATGPVGPQGAPGTPGPVGPQGVAGTDAILDIYDEATAANPTFSNLPVVMVGSSPLDGTADVPTTLLAFHLDEGSYRLDVATQFFHFVPAGTDYEDYGVLTMTVDGEAKSAPVWTGNIPRANNGAQATAWQHFEVDADGADVVIQGTLRSASPVATHAEAGAYVTVTKLG